MTTARIGQGLSPNGARILKNDEALRLRWYYDADMRPTIGYGHLILPSEMNLYTRLKPIISRAEAEALFERDVEPRVAQLNADLRESKVVLNQNQFDALVIFIFNIGIGAWLNSTARRDLMSGKLPLIPDQIERWVHGSHGQVIPGLVNRQRATAALFKQPINA